MSSNFYGDYTIKDKIGEGLYGQVYMGYLTRDANINLSFKKVKFERELNVEERKRFTYTL